MSSYATRSMAAASCMSASVRWIALEVVLEVACVVYDHVVVEAAIGSSVGSRRPRSAASSTIVDVRTLPCKCTCSSALGHAKQPFGRRAHSWAAPARGRLTSGWCPPPRTSLPGWTLLGNEALVDIDEWGRVVAGEAGGAIRRTGCHRLEHPFQRQVAE